MYLNNLTLTLEPWPWQFRLCFLWTVWSPLDPGPNKWPLRWRGCCWTVWPFDLCQSSTQSGSPPDTHWSPAENKLVNLNLAIFILQWLYTCSTIILIALVGTDVSVRGLLRKEETGMSRENSDVWAGDHHTLSHTTFGSGECSNLLLYPDTFVLL